MTHQDVLCKNPEFAALGFGMMRLPSDEETARMVDMYLGGGFNFFDTAYIYGGSEDTLRRTLSSRHPRDSFLVADKCPPWEASDPKSCDKLLHESFKRCGLDYFDFYLIHSLDAANYRSAISAGMFEWAAQQKAKGSLRHVGFSFHGTTELFEQVLTAHPEMEFVLLQLNYADILRGKAGELYDTARRHGKPIIVMEPVKGGSLAALPPGAEAILKSYAPDSSIASWAIRYAASLPGATCVLSGMSSVAQMQDNLKTYNPLKPITAEELDALEKALAEMSKISGIPCTYCKYCMAHCPQEIEISNCFSLYNDIMRGAEDWNVQMLYKSMPGGKRAGDCTGCGACLPRCPQQIDIPKSLGTVAAKFE